MKVLHLTHGYFPEGKGGVETYAREVLRGLRDAGVQVELATGSLAVWPEAGVEPDEVDGVAVHRVHRDDLYFDHYAKAYHPIVDELIEQLIRELAPDVVHVHQWIRLTNNLVEIADRCSVPAVVTLHDVYSSCPRCFRVDRAGSACGLPLRVESCFDCVPRFGHESAAEITASIEMHRDQMQRELAMARAIIVACEATAKLVADTSGADTSRAEVVPMASRPRFDGAEPPEPSATEPLRFGYWGSISPHKGLHVALAALRGLVDAGPSRAIELHLFGDADSPALDRELRELAAGLPVTFHGDFTADRIEAARLHVAVFPMLAFETHSFVLDECFELGLPCIVSDLGALAARSGGAAIRVPPADADALQAAMSRFVEEAGLWSRLAREVPAGRVSLPEHVARLVSIYRRAIESGPTGAEPIDARRRAWLIQLQRESALSRVCPERGPS